MIFPKTPKYEVNTVNQYDFLHVLSAIIWIYNKNYKLGFFLHFTLILHRSTKQLLSCSLRINFGLMNCLSTKNNKLR